MNRFTYEEKCIFLAAMSRELLVCEEVDKEMKGLGYPLETVIKLTRICQHIRNKVMCSDLWKEEESDER